MINADLAFDLLEHGTRAIEEGHTSTGRVNLAAVRAVGDASVLLGFSDFAKRCERFLKEASPRSFWEGVITNIPINRDSVSERARTLTPIEKIERKHPVFPENYASTVMRPEMGDHIAHCQTKNYDAAFSDAGPNEFRWYEVVLAQALNGDIQLALQKLKEIDSPTLKRHVRLVVAIESYRHGIETVGSEMYDQLQLNVMDEHTACNLALGVMNRIPWSYYPFADY